MKKVVISLMAVLAVAVMCAGFAGCDFNGQEGKTVTDQAGREVVIPEKIERIAVANMPPLGAALIQFLGGSDKIVGLPPNSITVAEGNTVAEKFVSNIDSIDTSYYSRGVLNAEKLAILKPDIVFASSTYEADIKTLEQAGFTVFTLNLQYGGINSLVTIESWYKLFGQIFDMQDKASKVIVYNNDMYATVKTRLASVTEYKKVLYIPWYTGDASSLWTSPSGYVGQYYSETTSAINVASAAGANDILSVEAVAEMNPDIIYLGSYAGATDADAFYTQANTTAYWGEVNAVKNKQVYKLPGGFCNWFMPTADSALSLLYQASLQYPEKFSDLDVKDTVKKYYSDFYGVTLTDAELAFMIG